MRTHWILVLIVLVMLPVSTRANDDSPLEAGSWALQFQVTDNFTLSSFQASVFSLKYHSSAYSAWRAGLSLSLNSATQELTQTEAGVPDPDATSRHSGFSTHIGFQYVRYANPEAKVVFLFGGGPYYRVLGSSSERYLDGYSVYQAENDAWSAGLSGLLGVEWLVASRIGIHAEYGFEFGYEKSQGTYAASSTVEREATDDRETLRFAVRRVLLGVSAYF